jgi:hypothetical protein
MPPGRGGRNCGPRISRAIGCIASNPKAKPRRKYAMRYSVLASALLCAVGGSCRVRQQTSPSPKRMTGAAPPITRRTPTTSSEHVGELGFVCRLVVLNAVAYRKPQGKIPANAEMLPIPKVSPGSLPLQTCKRSSKRRARRDRRWGLRCPAHRPRQYLEQRSPQSHERRRGQSGAGPVCARRTRLWHQRLANTWPREISLS